MKASRYATLLTNIDCAATALKVSTEAGQPIHGFGGHAVVMDSNSLQELSEELHKWTGELRLLLEGASVKVEED